MKLIAHRGNLNGKKTNLENRPDYVLEAINSGYDVEIDLWYKDGLWLGHDAPEYNINQQYLENYKDNLWIHAKNFDSVLWLSKTKLHWFWHQEDSYTITSRGYVWCYPNSPLPKNGICLLPEVTGQSYIGCAGICSDFIVNYQVSKRE